MPRSDSFEEIHLGFRKVYFNRVNAGIGIGGRMWRFGKKAKEENGAAQRSEAKAKALRKYSTRGKCCPFCTVPGIQQAFNKSIIHSVSPLFIHSSIYSLVLISPRHPAVTV